MFNKWPKIPAFHNLRHQIIKDNLQVRGFGVTYRAKPKIHGTHATIQILPNGRVFAQGRNKMLATSDDDNLGFATWVRKNDNFFYNWRDHNPITIYGEWAGPGIMAGTAANFLKDKLFFPYAVLYGDLSDKKSESFLITDPKFIRSYVHPDIQPIDWVTEDIDIDFYDIDDSDEIIEKINKLVGDVQKQDPWFKEIFGVEGPGEGLVFYPIPQNNKPPKFHSTVQWMFKAKTKEHRLHPGKSVQTTPPTVINAGAFVDMFLTDTRLEQAAREVNRGQLSFETKLLGPFLAWIMADIRKECGVELALSGLTWREIAPGIQELARQWYEYKIKDLNNLMDKIISM
jgi:hypothetical protein